MEEADKELIIRYFYGRCTPDEARRAQELLHLPEADDFIRELSRKEWDEPVQEDHSLSAIHRRWKEKVNERILSVKRGTVEKIEHRLFRRLHFLGNAAVWAGILVLAGIAVWQIKNATTQEPAITYIKKEHLRGAPIRYVLPDSSIVFLAAGGTLSYPETYPRNGREVRLQGAAFFDVKRDEEHPFIIHTGKVQTRVLGTSFKVTAVAGRPIEVAVATGKVGVSRRAEMLATLTPGHKVTWHEQEQKAVLEQVDIDGLQRWKNGDLIFDRMNMEDIATELQNRYGVRIVFVDQAVKTNRVSGTFSAVKTVDQVVKILALAGKFSYESKDEETFMIYKAN